MPALEDMWANVDAEAGATPPKPSAQQNWRKVNDRQAELRVSPKEVERQPMGSPVRRFDEPTPETGSIPAEQMEFVHLLDKAGMDGYYRTLAEQGIDTLELLEQASKDGVLHQKLRHACVPGRVRDVLYEVVQIQALRSWDQRHQDGGSRKPRSRAEPASTMTMEGGKLTKQQKKKRSGPVVRQTRASRCGAVWTERRCEHLGDRDHGAPQNPAVLDKQFTRSRALSRWQTGGTRAGMMQRLGGAFQLETPEQKRQEREQFNFNAHTLHVRQIPSPENLQGRTLHIGGLVGQMEQTECLTERFSAFGDVRAASVRIRRNDPDGKVSWGLVTFATKHAADRALADSGLKQEKLWVKLIDVEQVMLSEGKMQQTMAIHKKQFSDNDNGRSAAEQKAAIEVAFAEAARWPEQVVNVSVRQKTGVEAADGGMRLTWALVTMRDIAARDNVLENRPIFIGEKELGVTKLKVPKVRTRSFLCTFFLIEIKKIISQDSSGRA